MIKSIEITNFKCIENSGLIEIKPITLLMGPNSSGKSSIIKPFLLMKQTADSRDMQQAVKIDGNYVSLGSYNDFVYKHEKERNVQLIINFEAERSLLWRKVERDVKGARLQTFRTAGANIEASITFKSGVQDQILSEIMVYNLKVASDTFSIAKFRKAKGIYSGFVSRLEDNALVRYSPPKKAKFYDINLSPRSSANYYSFSRSEVGANMPHLLSYLTREFEMIVSNIFYIGPIREEPALLYSGVVERPQDVGTAGEDAASVLWIERSVSKKATLSKRVEYWMDKFEISKSFVFKKLGPFFQLLLTDWHMGIKANLTDVGFGASQLLPIIVEGYYTPENSLVIAEQPEIHLHPKAQTLLADLFIDISKQKKKLLIETHSEHLLMRIQRRIAEDVIDTNDVALYYCEPTDLGTKVKRIEINEYGQLGEDLPEGFFEEGYVETQELLRAIASRKKKESGGE